METFFLCVLIFGMFIPKPLGHSMSSQRESGKVVAELSQVLLKNLSIKYFDPKTKACKVFFFQFQFNSNYVCPLIILNFYTFKYALSGKPHLSIDILKRIILCLTKLLEHKTNMYKPIFCNYMVIITFSSNAINFVPIFKVSITNEHEDFKNNTSIFLSFS